MVDKNPNHKKEDPNKQSESKETRAVNRELEIQDVNEDFMSLKNKLLYYINKENLNEFSVVTKPESRFLMLDSDFSKEDVIEQGLDLCIIVDGSESMYPYRIYQKKSLYFSLMDLEDFVFSSTDLKPEDLNKIRIAYVQYDNRDNDEDDEDIKNSKNLKVVDFVEYKQLGDICKEIDKLDIKKHSIKKRNVMDGLKAAGELNWNEDSAKVILHYCADSQYGKKFTSNPKGMPEDYDPFPEGIKLDLETIYQKLADLNCVYNLIKFNDRILALVEDLNKNDINVNSNSPKLIELK